MRSRQVARAVLPAAARGGSIFLGAFILVGLVGVVRGRGRDINLWWIDLRDFPAPLQAGLLLAFGVVVLAWAFAPAPPRRLRRLAAVLAVVFAGLAGRDAIRFWDVVGRGLVHPMMIVPLSALIAVALAVLAVAMIRTPARATDRTGRGPAVGMLLAAVGWASVFPLAQMLFFGTSDYRRPADAAVIFGARVYASGQPSPLLRDRIATGVDLYRAGLVPILVMSGGDGADGFNEAAVMRDAVLAQGVPADAIRVDRAGVTTEATVANSLALVGEAPGASGGSPGAGTSGGSTGAGGSAHAGVRLIAVSQAYHLPRVELAFEAAGIDVFTVPAAEVQPISEMPLLVLREIPAFWSYFLRDCLF